MASTLVSPGNHAPSAKGVAKPTRQDSFKFLEEFNAGILVNDEKELVNAIEIIADDYERYCQSALKCFLNYIQPEKHLQKMIQQFESI